MVELKSEDELLIKHQITNNKRKQQVMNKEKKWKNQITVIVNSKAEKTRPITLEVLVQEKKIGTKKIGKEDNINSELAQKSNTDINNRGVCPLCNRSVETGVECGICSRWFLYKCEGTTEGRVLKEYAQETHYICKKDKEQKKLEVAIRVFRKQLQEEEESSIAY